MYSWGLNRWGEYLWGESFELETSVMNVTLLTPSFVAYGGGRLAAEVPFMQVAMASTSVHDNVALTLKRHVVRMTGSWIPGGSLAVTMPMIQLATTGSGGPSSMEITLMTPRVYMAGSGQVYTTFVVSTKDGAVTTYSNHTYNSYFEMGGRFFGVSSSGIYELTGSSDSGVDISASFTTGGTNVGAKKPISPNDLYTLLTSEGDVVFRTVVDNVVGAPYTIETTFNRYRYRKLDLGKGRVGFKIGLNVESSKPFELDSMKLVVDEKTHIHPGQESWMKVKIPMVTISTS